MKRSQGFADELLDGLEFVGYLDFTNSGNLVGLT